MRIIVENALDVLAFGPESIVGFKDLIINGLVKVSLPQCLNDLISFLIYRYSQHVVGIYERQYMIIHNLMLLIS